MSANVQIDLVIEKVKSGNNINLRDDLKMSCSKNNQWYLEL